MTYGVALAPATLPTYEIPCSQDHTDSNYQTIKLTENTRLAGKDSQGHTCLYRLHLDITESNLTLDCQGATLKGSVADEQKSWESSLAAPPANEDEAEAIKTETRPEKPSFGIRVSSLSHSGSLQNISIKNCTVEGFERNFEINAPQSRKITIEDSKSLEARSYGVFIAPQTTEVTLRRVDVIHSGASGIYAGIDSKNLIVTGGRIQKNGANTSLPHQDGITLVSSAQNLIVGNLFEENQTSGVSLYHDCGQLGSARPATEPTDNTLRSNHFKNEKIGVWLASRQSMNQKDLACSAPKTFQDSKWELIADSAKRNLVTKNTFTANRIAIRIEDDENTISENTFKGPRPEGYAVVVGHKFGRPRDLRRPVQKCTLASNSAAGLNAQPYRYCSTLGNNTLSKNAADGKNIDRLSPAEELCQIHDGTLPSMEEPLPAMEKAPSSAPPLRHLASEKQSDLPLQQKTEAPAKENAK